MHRRRRGGDSDDDDDGPAGPEEDDGAGRAPEKGEYAAAAGEIKEKERILARRGLD